MKQVVVVAFAVLLAVSMAVLVMARDRRHAPSEAEDYAHLPKKTDQLPALYASPDFSFRNQQGEPVTKASLAGQPYVANFVFTTCRTVCPLLTAKMVRLQRDLPGVPMHFVSFSVDPEHDTVEALAKYAEQWNADEQRWQLLETSDEGLAKLTEGFHVTAQKTDGGVDAVMHSAVFMLVDGQGVVRGVYDSEDPEDFKKLAGAARTLAGGGQAPKVATAPRSGEVLYHELSCSNCHAHPELAPQLGGLLGRKRELETRAIITADEAYVRESIVAPVAKRVAGFPLMMPSYAGHVSDEELGALVKYVIALPEPVAAATDVKVAVDPVCHMQVRVTETALSFAVDGGETQYFCSAWCKARYAENPDAYRK
jgi:protein SCO1/2